YPVLGKVVGTDSLGAVAAANQSAAGHRLGFLAAANLGVEQARLQNGHGAGAVLVLGAFVLALHHDAGRQVGDALRGVGLVDVLAAGAGGAVGVYPKLVRLDVNLVDLLGLGQDGHGACRGMDASLGLGFRHPLHPVHARFELELRPRAASRHPADDLLVAAGLALAAA